MILCNILVNEKPALGAIYRSRVVNLEATLSGQGEADVARWFTTLGVSPLESLLKGWPESFALLKAAFSAAIAEDRLIYAPEGFAYLPPVFRPGTFRDFYAFETHVRNARKLRGLEIAPEWFKFPVFYFSNPNTISTTGATIKFPSISKKWDYELEIGAVLGGDGSNLTPAQAENLIAGYLILNDWTARDIQREEMAVSLGPAKGKDFATSIGPWFVTPDELADRADGKGFNLKMTASINGELTSAGNWATIHYSFGEMIARASQDARVYAGELFGSGTVGFGCLLERGAENILWLHSGDVVKLEIERLGTLENRVG